MTSLFATTQVNHLNCIKCVFWIVSGTCIGYWIRRRSCVDLDLCFVLWDVWTVYRICKWKIRTNLLFHFVFYRHQSCWSCCVLLWNCSGNIFIEMFCRNTQQKVSHHCWIWLTVVIVHQWVTVKNKTKRMINGRERC